MTGADRVRVIGLTGGIATGKSSVARILEECGACVIDADQLSREAVLPGTPGLERVAEEFGRHVLLQDGSLDRLKLRNIVFAAPERRKALERILHPEIKRLAEERIADAVISGKRMIFYMAPLLIEAGATDRVDEVWVVTVAPEVQLERLMARDRITPEEARAVIASQMPLAEKVRYGRVVIDNSGTIEQTRRMVEEIWFRETGERR